jgi:hypothetical protein
MKYAVINKPVNQANQEIILKELMERATGTYRGSYTPTYEGLIAGTYTSEHPSIYNDAIPAEFPCALPWNPTGVVCDELLGASLNPKTMDRSTFISSGGEWFKKLQDGKPLIKTFANLEAAQKAADAVDEKYAEKSIEAAQCGSFYPYLEEYAEVHTQLNIASEVRNRIESCLMEYKRVSSEDFAICLANHWDENSLQKAA